MDELATDYDDRVRKARESEGLSQSDLANELNEKASLIRKIERGDTLPSDDVQSTARVLRQLGCDIPPVPEDGATIRVGGVGLRGWRSPSGHHALAAAHHHPRPALWSPRLQ